MSAAVSTLENVFLGTPRKLPRASTIPGRVVVLDIAFAAEGTGTTFEKVTGRFLSELGDRLAMWVDHHDHVLHERFATDPRFVLTTKREHGACPELVTPALVARAGPVDSVVCHDDLDGLYSAAKWLRGGVEPYEFADDDARCIDTRVGTPTTLGRDIDYSLRARPRDATHRLEIVSFLVDGARDPQMRANLRLIAEEFAVRRVASEALAANFEREGALAIVDVRASAEATGGGYDKTELLLLGQRLAAVSAVVDATTVAVAAPYDSGVDLCALLGIEGGMPTRVSVPLSRLDDVRAIGQRLAQSRKGNDAGTLGATAHEIASTESEGGD